MKICHLRKGMDAAVRPSASLKLNGLCGHFRKKGLQLSLDRILRAFLPLPSLVSCPLILKNELKIPHLANLPLIFSALCIALTAKQGISYHCVHIIIRIKCHVMAYRYIGKAP